MSAAELARELARARAEARVLDVAPWRQSVRSMDDAESSRRAPLPDASVPQVRPSFGLTWVLDPIFVSVGLGEPSACSSGAGVLGFCGGARGTLVVPLLDDFELPRFL